MKRLKVSILAVVAVLAIGLTAFTKAEPAGKRVTVTNCYEILDPAWNGCSYSLVQLDATASPATPSCTVAEAQVTIGLDAQPSSFVSSKDCDLTKDVFCCARLIVDASPCISLNQPIVTFRDASGAQITNYAEISEIFCKTN